MSFINGLKEKEMVARKAQAYDEMQNAQAAQEIKQQGMAEMLNKVRQDELAKQAAIASMGYRASGGAQNQYVSPEMVNALQYQEREIPQGYTQGTNSIQGTPVAQAQRMPNLLTSNETVTPPPSGLGAVMAGRQ